MFVLSLLLFKVNLSIRSIQFGPPILQVTTSQWENFQKRLSFESVSWKSISVCGGEKKSLYRIVKKCPVVHSCICVVLSYKDSHLVQSHLTGLCSSCQGSMHFICEYCIVHTHQYCGLVANEVIQKEICKYLCLVIDMLFVQKPLLGQLSWFKSAFCLSALFDSGDISYHIIHRLITYVF